MAGMEIQASEMQEVLDMLELFSSKEVNNEIYSIAG